MSEFRCTVRTSTGLPVANVGLRVLSLLDQDVTALLFGSSPVYTNAVGVFRFLTPFITRTDVIQSGFYNIVGSAPGYESNKVLTPATFNGTGLYDLTLDGIAPADEIDIILPSSTYVSPMAPVEIEVPAAASSAKWEYIEATITSENGADSVIEVPVTNGVARLNLQARFELDTALHLVGDDVAAAIDPSFSDTFTVSLASLTPSGRQDLNTSFILKVANAFPTGEENDLSNFTNDGGLAEWLTPWAVLPKFLGHYASAQIWLTVAGAGEYIRRTAFYDINNALLQTINTVLDAALFTPGNVVTVRIPEPIAGAYYARVTILHLGAAQTQPLNVRFIRG